MTQTAAVGAIAERQAFMSREKSNNSAATMPRLELEHLYHEPVSFGEPLMFLVDEARLQEYFRVELLRVNNFR